MKRFILLVLLLAGTFGYAAAQQTRTVTGRVADETGLPMIGAVVQVVGTNNATTTGPEGIYTLKNVAHGAVLRVSFLGYDNLEKTADADRIDFDLTSSSQQIASVVVTGMQKMDKRIFTGATDQLVASDVKLDGIGEISRSLEGRAAGVSVQNVSGTFGAAPKIRVRGATSIYGDSKPLWVVDGVIMEDVVDVDANSLSSGDATTLISSAIAGLNSDDIESFQILKDGSATSIYGARAMAGVIVVTTKKGKAGEARVSYTGEYSMRLIPSYANFNIMNSQEQMAVYKEMYDKGWLNYADNVYASSSGVYGKMSQLINSYDPTTGYGVPNTVEGRNAYLRQAEFRNTDWFKELFRASIQHSHSVSISSGSEKGSYYASVGALVDPGWTIQSKVNRYTALFNTTQNILKDKLTLNIIGNASYRQQRAPGTLSSETDPVFGTVTRDFDINPYSYALRTSRTLDPDEFYTRNYTPFNIKDELSKNYMDLNVVDTKFQAELKWKITPKLEVAALGAIKYSASTTEHHVKEGSNMAETYRSMPNSVIQGLNPYLYDNPDTDCVPDSGPTAASRSTMVVGRLAEEAAMQMKERLDEEHVEIETEYRHPDGHPWDQSTFKGDAYLGYGWGCACVEVEVDRLTNEVKVVGIWSSHDIGKAIDELIVHGQVNGGIIQSLGYASMEKMENRNGHFRQTSMSDYVVPTSMDFPRQEWGLVDNPYEWGPFGAKGMGELVFNGADAAYIDALERALDVTINRIPMPVEDIEGVRHD